MSDPERRRFRPLSAMRVIQAKVVGIPQHVGLILARMTRAEQGEVALRLDELTRVTGWSHPTLTRAVRELVAAGLLESIRRGSVANVYRWRDIAYMDAAVGEHLKNRYSPDDGADGGEAVAAPWALELLIQRFLEQRERTYQIPQAVGAQSAQSALRTIMARFEHLAHVGARGEETHQEAVDRLVRKGLRVWFRREGHNQFLVRQRHPLERLVADLDWVTSELRVPPSLPADKRPASAAVLMAGQPREQKQINVSGGHSVLAALGNRRER